MCGKSAKTTTPEENRSRNHQLGGDLTVNLQIAQLHYFSFV